MLALAAWMRLGGSLKQYLIRADAFLPLIFMALLGSSNLQVSAITGSHCDALHGAASSLAPELRNGSAPPDCHLT